VENGTPLRFVPDYELYPSEGAENKISVLPLEEESFQIQKSSF